MLRVDETDRFLSVAKMFFAYGLGNSLTFPLAAGATAILHPSPPTPAGMAELIAAEAPTLFFSSPGFCAGLLDKISDPTVFRSLRATVTAGESLPANIQTRFSQLTGSPVLDGIGSTELLHIFISNSLDAQVPGSSGRIVPGYEAELRDDDDRIVDAPDTPGYLQVKGDSAAVGYWQRPDATAASFRTDGWVRTGDVYTRSADDVWTFLGRNNDMIKAGGIWVSPAEVEATLIEHETVLEAAVVGAATNWASRSSSPSLSQHRARRRALPNSNGTAATDCPRSSARVASSSPTTSPRLRRERSNDSSSRGIDV